MLWQECTTIDSNILVGKPVIVAVEFIVDLLAQGWPESETLRNYPGLTTEDLRVCLGYVSELLKTEKVYTLLAA